MPRRQKLKATRFTWRRVGAASGVVLLGLAVLAVMSLIRPELTGFVGRVSNYVLTYAFGSHGAWIFALALLVYGVKVTILRRDSVRTTIGLTLLGIGLFLILYLWIPPIQRALLTWRDGGSVGTAGVIIGGLAATLFGEIGSWILVFVLVVLGLLLLTDSNVRAVVRLVGKGVRFVWQILVTQSKRVGKRKAPPKSAPAPSPAVSPAVLTALPEATPMVTPDPPPAPVVSGEAQRVEQLMLPAGEYSLPDLNLLNRGLKVNSARGSREEKDNIRVLEETLANFGIKARVAEVTRGPTYTRYEIHLGPGTKVSRVTGLSNDIAMSLASEGVRIEAPIPGKAAIGIEVPNKARTTVSLRDVLEGDEYQASTAALTVALGKDIEGHSVVADLAQMPHLLIAGATGTGKSVCINSLICSILYKSRPDEVKLMLIDPKVVELSAYNGIPHLIAPVLNHPKKASAALKWAVAEMEKRYGIFARAGVRDIERFNERAKERGTERLPLILIVIDELADLMMVARAEVEDAICRLAQMARAAGMHLVIGTQRPSTDVITGLIKANIPSRLSFTVSSAVDSRVILDEMGAEKLLGRGDMLFSPVGQSKARRIQGAFVSNREIERVVDFVASQGEASYVAALDRLEETDHTVKDGEGGLDERFDDAVRIVVETGQASVSMLQRRMRLGYTRAARIVDQMQESGIVGPADGSKPRAINRTHPAVKAVIENAKRAGLP